MPRKPKPDPAEAAKPPERIKIKKGKTWLLYIAALLALMLIVSYIWVNYLH